MKYLTDNERKLLMKVLEEIIAESMTTADVFKYIGKIIKTNEFPE